MRRRKIWLLTVWLVAACASNGVAQVEVGLVAGFGSEHSSLAHLYVDGQEGAELTQYGGADMSVSGGLFVSSRPYLGWGWRMAVIASSRNFHESYDLRRDGVVESKSRLADHGIFYEGWGQATYLWPNWWGAGIGVGATGHSLNLQRPTLVAPLAVASLSRGTSFADFELRMVVISKAVSERNFRDYDASATPLKARLTHLSTSLSVYIPIGRVKWLGGRPGGKYVFHVPNNYPNSSSQCSLTPLLFPAPWPTPD